MAVKRSRRNPYTVGGIVRGTNFYGRSALIDTILDGNDRAVWIVGNRRIGKSSLLYRLAERGNAAGRVAFHVSLEGADSMAEFVQCFTDDLDPNDRRLTRLRLKMEDLNVPSPHDLVRILDRQARERGIEVLLLLDEAEALIGLVKNEGDGCLKDLRRAMQRSEALRVVLAATKRLEELHDICGPWDTSPFLFGVTPRYLGRMERDEVLALVRQTQLPDPENVGDQLAEAILAATDGHPFLTQWLCDRLWTEQGLRPLTDNDLIPDDSLINLFQIDYNHLALAERRILWCLANVEALDAATLLEKLGGNMSSVQLHRLANALTQLCYIRRVGEQFALGNQLLCNWFQLALVDEPAPPVSDAAAEEWADEERQSIIKVMTAHKRRLRVLEEQQALQGSTAPPETVIEIEDIKAKLAGLERELAHLRARR